jgi:hypothetical protein
MILSIYVPGDRRAGLEEKVGPQCLNLSTAACKTGG